MEDNNICTQNPSTSLIWMYREFFCYINYLDSAINLSWMYMHDKKRDLLCAFLAWPICNEPVGFADTNSIL